MMDFETRWERWRRQHTEEDVILYNKFIGYICNGRRGLATHEEYSQVHSAQGGWMIAQRLPQLFIYWRAVTALGVTPLRPEEYLEQIKEGSDE